MRRRKHKPRTWGKAAERELFNGVGISGVDWFKRRCGGRSRSAVYQKLRREYGRGGLTRGAYTLHELENGTQYGETQIRRAGAALNQKWKRLGPRGAHLITEEQMREIVAWLGHDFWSKRHHLYGCTWCQTDRRPHRAAGLCERCYHKHRRACVVLCLPTSLAEQAAVLRKASGRVNEVVLGRLVSGLALKPSQIDSLVCLTP
jgi:hypothetical protein